MKTVSNEYIRTMEQRRDFYAVAEITFQDGTQKTLEKKDFTLSGNSVVQSGESSTFPLGLVIPKVINICLMNDDDRWSEYDFFGAKIFLRTKFDLNNGTTESINAGNFTVVTPESYGTTIEITATDDSYKLDKEYATNIRYPATIQTALIDSCRTCGVTLFSSIFENADFEIQQKPENLTHRQFIGLCAMIAGGNAYFDEYNRLVIQTYDFSEFERAGLDGGYFDNLNASRYMSGDNADGGGFNPWNTGDSIDGGNFKDMKNIHVLHAFKSGIKIGTDDVVITGVKLVKGKEEWLFGSEGYVLSFENQLATGQEEEAVQLIGELIVGLKFRPFTGDHVAYPLADFMDLALLVDLKGNVYRTVLTDIDFQYYGFTTLKCSADSPIRNSSKYYGNEVKAIVLARQIVEKEISDYDQTAQDMTAMISQGFGLFFTKVEKEDGSVISYMHDKPTMAESSYIVTNTRNGLLVSNNGGTSWAVDKNGNALLNVLSVVGFYFDWAKGGTLTLGGYDNANGVLNVLDSDGNQIGYFGKDGLEVLKGIIKGPSITLGGLSNKYGTLTVLDKNGLVASLLNNESLSFYTNTETGRRAVGKIISSDEYYETAGNPVTAIAINCYKHSYSTSGNALVTVACSLILSEGGRITPTCKMMNFSNCDEVYFSGSNGKIHFTGLSTASSGYGAILVDGGLGVGYQLYRGTSSSSRYKNIERNMDASDVDDLYKIQPVMASYKNKYLSEADERYNVSHPMFIAEDVEKYFPLAVDHDKNGEPENWNLKVMIPSMFQMLKEQKKEIEALKEEISSLRKEVK